MCCCGKPTVNGEPDAYSWDGRTFMMYSPSPPPLSEGDTLLWDEPGRCGKIDSHSHHFRLVKDGSFYVLLVRHGGGDERFYLGLSIGLFLRSIGDLDSNQRYWLMHTLHAVKREAAANAKDSEAAYWRKAAAEKRIKVRKVRGKNLASVTVEPPRSLAIAA